MTEPMYLIEGDDLHSLVLSETPIHIKVAIAEGIRARGPAAQQVPIGDCHYCDRCIEAERRQAREDVLKILREHLIKSSESGVCPCGWEPTDPNRACENDTCAVCIFDKAVESLRSEVGK